MEDVDVALAALADPTRRRVIERLLDKPSRTNELAEAAKVSVPAVSRHLRVLRDRGLVERTDVEGDGRGRMYRLNPSSLSTVSNWLDRNHWVKALSDSATPDAAEYLTRVGGFLDGFANSDVGFFEQHLAEDVRLLFPGSANRWDKASAVDSVADHPPYVAWTISESSVTSLGAGLVLVVITVEVQTTAHSKPSPVVQSMVFDDSNDPWTLRFLHQSAVS